MVTSFQGLKIGEQVRSSMVNEQQPYYQNRTQRLIYYQRQEQAFNDLRKQAENINSNIKDFEDYKRTYAGLSPQLRQFFKAPEEIEQEIEIQKQKDIIKVDVRIEELQKQRDDIEKAKQKYIEYSMGYDVKERNAQLRDYERQINQINVKIDALMQNKGKVSEGYSVESILNYAEEKSQFETKKSEQRDIIKELSVIPNISDWEKKYPTEKLIIDKQGKVIGVESGTFQRTFNLENYEKVIKENNVKYEAYIKEVSKGQSIAPFYKAINSKAFDPEQFYIKFDKEFTLKDIGRPNVLPSVNQTEIVSLFPFKTQVKTPEYYQKKYEGKISFEQYIDYKYKQAIIKTGQITGFTSEFEKKIIPEPIYSLGSGFASALTPSIMGRTLLFAPAMETTTAISKNLGILTETRKTSNIQFWSNVEEGGKVKTEYLIEQGGKKIKGYGVQDVKVLEEGLTFGRGGIAKIKKLGTGITQEIRDTVKSASQKLGETNILKKGKIIEYDFGTGVVSRTETKPFEVITSAEIIKGNKYMKNIVKNSEESIKLMQPTKQKALLTVKQSETSPQYYAVSGSTRFEELKLKLSEMPQTEIRLKEVKYIDEFTGEIIKPMDYNRYLEKIGVENMGRLKRAKIYDFGLIEEYVKRARIKTTDFNIKGVVEITPSKLRTIKEGTFEIIQEGKIETISDDQLVKISDRILEFKKTPLSRTFPKEEVSPVTNIEKRIMDKLYPEDKALTSGFPDRVITTEKISGEAGTINNAIKESVKNALEKRARVSDLDKALSGINIPIIDESSIFGKGEIMPRGQVWGKYNEKSNLGVLNAKTNMPDVLEKSNFNYKENNKLMDRVNQSIKDSLKNAIESKMSQEQSQKSEDVLKFRDGLSFAPMDKSIFKEMEGLKLREAQILETEFMGDFSPPPFDNILVKPSIPFIPVIPTLENLKYKVKKKMKKKRIKSINEYALLPDFTSRAFGLEPETISMKDINKALRKINTGFEIKRGAKIRI